jgi:transcriptional regulator with XRE-family HTH domain
MSTTADLLECLRRRHKLSQTEIARRTGIPQPRLSRWERGDVPDAADDSLKLADLVDALGEPPADSETTPAEQGA